MKYYIEITLLPSVEIGINVLWEKVFKQLHLGFVEIKNANNKVPIGISFPEYNVGMKRFGQKLRLFAHSEAILKEFNVSKLLRYLDDYVHLKRIRSVPETTAYAVYHRHQAKKMKSKFNLAKRKVKRKGLDFPQALQDYDGYREERIDTPYINIKSQSTGEYFRLFILKKLSDKNSDKKEFSCYGLDSKSTVPEF